MHAPKSSNMEAALRVVKYVKQAPGFGILMSAKPTDILQDFVMLIGGLVLIQEDPSLGT